MTVRQPRLPSFYRLVALDSIDSTNEEARRRIAAAPDDVPEGMLIWAAEQTAGRGRRGRSWSSPRGNLYLSLVLRPACAPGTAAQLGFVAAVALAETLSETLAGLLPGPDRVRLKWPNDVLVDGAKVSGILLEAVSATAATVPGRLDTVILGVGVNLQSRPESGLYRSISLREAGAATDPADLLERFAERLLAWYDIWRREGFAPLRAAWLDRAAGIGQTIEVRLDHETLVGRFATLDESGALALDLPDDGRRLVAAGDVFFPGL
jgi:BirA family biotin operon repressor/biotin-[acetyl-CoA-carboxylase] ligase